MNKEVINITNKGKISRKYIIIIRSGSNKPLCLNDYVESSDVTLVLSFYERAGFDVDKNWWAFEGGLSKFHAAKKIFEEFPVLLEHEQFAFFDPDVSISFADVLQCFDRGYLNGLGVYQPSVDKDSFTNWEFLKSRELGLKWIETSFVEVMAPFFSKQSLDIVWPYFDESISTWGLEYNWYANCWRQPMGVINDVRMKHETPVDTVDGPFYRYLKSIGIDPLFELNRLKSQYVPWYFKERAFPGYIPRKCKNLYLLCAWVGLVIKLKLKRISSSSHSFVRGS